MLTIVVIVLLILILGGGGYAYRGNIGAFASPNLAWIIGVVLVVMLLLLALRPGTFYYF